jgi:hypothetical protein
MVLPRGIALLEEPEELEKPEKPIEKMTIEELKAKISEIQQKIIQPS